MFKTLRISHPALTGAKNAETVRFYTETLGMELVLRQPNLDYPAEEHLFFHVGNDNFIAYFVPVDEASAAYQPAQCGSGGMDHLALDVDSAAFAEAQRRLTAAGVPFEGPADRGYERSIYFKDPNNVTIELLTWITPPPPGLPLAAVIKRAQRLREQRGAAIIEDADVRRAIAELEGGRRQEAVGGRAGESPTRALCAHPPGLAAPLIGNEGTQNPRLPTPDSLPSQRRTARCSPSRRPPSTRW